MVTDNQDLIQELNLNFSSSLWRLSVATFCPPDVRGLYVDNFSSDIYLANVPSLMGSCLKLAGIID